MDKDFSCIEHLSHLPMCLKFNNTPYISMEYSNMIKLNSLPNISDINISEYTDEYLQGIFLSNIQEEILC